MSEAARYTHCPSCLAEYGTWSTMCVDCGSPLVPGPSPPEEAIEPGGLEVIEREGDGAATSLDRFALEETSVVLVSMIEEDADALLAALDEEEIGARRGKPTGDGVEIIVHAANLMDSQAVLVEFTGDVRLVDEIAVDPERDGAVSDLAVVTWTRLHDVGAQANRLRERGLDVRIELPDEAERSSPAAQAAILVPVDELDRAREILGIEL